MNDVDDGEFARELFGRLAATMPDNPDRPATVQRMVRRRHRRRAATRATVGLTFAAGVGLVLVDARRPQPLPAAAAAATASTDVAAGKSADRCADLTTSDKALAGSDAVPADDVGRIKVSGLITAVDGDTISVSAQESTVDIADITATIASDAKYIDGGELTATRPTLAVGDRVSFGAIKQADGSYTIDMLEAHAAERARGDQTGTTSEVPKPAASPDEAAVDAAKRQHAIEECGATTG